MNITQLRNATIIVDIGGHRILVDPMLAPMGAIPPLKYATRSRRRNPLVELPVNTSAELETVTHCLITHCQKGHFDHLDRAGAKWLRQHDIPVYCMAEDADFLARKGLSVIPLQPGLRQAFLGGELTPVPCLHGRGLVSRFMAHGHGYFLEFPGEPSVYIAGDTILTDDVRRCILQNQPDVCVVPAGGANFDIGGEIIMGVDDVRSVTRISTGIVVANHLESLDHCPVTRDQIRAMGEREDLGARLRVPDDGETLVFPPQPPAEVGHIPVLTEELDG
ncbi:MBL fold metallo-hydrolase [Marinobacter sp. OP 3.4]|uniref:MBL fold metallo-hydrolase n=1 Tax=Marinobacter sp. OP 3.4 TaxID=3076501 RepID=UPI002E1EFBF3